MTVLYPDKLYTVVPLNIDLLMACFHACVHVCVHAYTHFGLVELIYTGNLLELGSCFLQ